MMPRRSPSCRTLSLAVALALFAFVGSTAAKAQAPEQVPLTVEAAEAGAPITLGLPFPKGALRSPDHVRLLSAEGEEIPAQVTEVTTWAPADSSIKWIWVFFFAEDADRYILEYGEDVRRMPIEEERRLYVKNNMRRRGFVEVDTGPLRFRVDQGEGGFLGEVELDADGNGRFDGTEVIATEPEGRGSFLDLLDDAGVDSSRAVVRRTWVERGSGPLHAIIRVEGEYQYAREDNNPAPFTMRIHAYAGKPFVRVLHTLTYTGEPDKHPPLEGEHAAIATQPDSIVNEERLEGNPRWMEPEDRVAGAGLTLDYRLEGPLRYRTGYREGAWWEPEAPQVYETTVEAQEHLAVRQAGPGTGEPEEYSSSATERIGGFSAQILSDSTSQLEATRAAGWMDVSNERWGVSVGVRHFFEEYPKELSLQVADSQAVAYLWPASAPPMSFARASAESEGGMVDNFAQGLAKTTEFVYNFHPANDEEDVERTVGYVLDPPVAHADPSWYAESKAFGSMAPRSERFAAYERGLDYKFDWWLFNQNWEPWYGMFDYGDGKAYYFGDEWFMWTNNEPAVDYMWWLEFMRTGERKYYLAAEAASRHAMDVDNVHWPAGPEYVGDDNEALTYWESQQEPPGTPYLGMGRRHASQHWTALLSAHVWVPGWLASYYLSGYHRGLDVARQTADYYRRRIFGEHSLTGRRLYLSVWNLVEAWDATKDEGYRAELEDRVGRMLRLQEEQNGSLVIDRYGYAQVYASHGLGKYLDLTGDPAVREALLRHARRMRDVPPYDHDMESYLSSIHSLLLGYELSGEPSLYREARERAQVLQTDALSGDRPFRPSRTQADLAEALEEVSHLPGGEGPRPPIWKITNGLRIFGWTHIYNIPYLVYWLERDGTPAPAAEER